MASAAERYEQVLQQQRDAMAALVRQYGGTAVRQPNGLYKMRGQVPYEARKALADKFSPTIQAALNARTQAARIPAPATSATSEPQFDYQNVINSITATTQNLQKQIADQQAAFQTKLAEQQNTAEEAKRQLMINMQRGDRAPAAVKTASSGAEQSGLTRRGTTGYFGRRGMRIGSLNVPSTGLAIAPNMQMSTSGSFA